MSPAPLVGTPTTLPTYWPQSPARPPSRCRRSRSRRPGRAVCWWVIGWSPGRSISRDHRTAPLDASRANSTWRGPSPPRPRTATRWPRSKAGVPVMPSGSMLPHGRVDSRTGVPRFALPHDRAVRRIQGVYGVAFRGRDDLPAHDQRLGVDGAIEVRRPDRRQRPVERREGRPSYRSPPRRGGRRASRRRKPRPERLRERR